MLNWNDFAVFASGAVACWSGAAVLAYRKAARKWVLVLLLTGTVVFGGFIAGLWWTLERPPLRTMGETRLFYSWFVVIVGMLIYLRWRYAWILTLSTVLAAVFIVVNLVRPEIHDKALMPALQSFWFVPHVIVYMFAYALLGCALLAGIYGYLPGEKVKISKLFEMADNLVYWGVALLTLGMLFGALWAKQAWGHYWGWDPKETWAAVTWFGYLFYIHWRYYYPERRKEALAILITTFVFLQMCWYGANYLPSAAMSVHSY